MHIYIQLKQGSGKQNMIYWSGKEMMETGCFIASVVFFCTSCEFSSADTATTIIPTSAEVSERLRTTTFARNMDNDRVGVEAMETENTKLQRLFV